MRNSQRSVTPENPPWAQWAKESSPMYDTGSANPHMRGSGKMFPTLVRYYAEVGDNMASSCSRSATPFGNNPGASFTWALAL